MNTCEHGQHNKVVQDKFAKLPGVKRHVPGDCWCLDCDKPIPAWWNGGHIIAVDGYAEEKRR